MSELPTVSLIQSLYWCCSRHRVEVSVYAISHCLFTGFYHRIDKYNLISRLGKTGQDASSPVSSLSKPLDKFVLLGQIDLNLLAEVEDWTVPAGAENFLVETTLAALALSPQTGKPLLQSSQARDMLLINLTLLRLAVATHRLALILSTSGQTVFSSSVEKIVQVSQA